CGQNCSSCRGHEFGLDMFLIDRRMPQQIRGCRSWNGENAVLAVNKAAADVDRGAEKTFDSKRVEADSSADGIHDGVHGADLMKLDVFRRDVVHLAFGYRQLRKYLRCQAFCVGPELAVPDHLQDLGRPPVKMSVTLSVLVAMSVSMLVF